MSQITTAEPLTELLRDLRIHDVDTHLVDTPDIWTSRVSEAKWGDAIPQLAVLPDGGTAWLIGGKPAMRSTPFRATKKDGEDHSGAKAARTHPYYDEVSWRGGFVPSARLEWMDRHGIYSQVLYPNLVGFANAAFVKNLEEELATECIRAYNDYQTDFCSGAPDRLIALANLPWWNIDAAISELHRCVEMGHHGVNLGWRFEDMGFPRLRDDHWRPLLDAIEETGLSINFHTGFGINPDDDPTFQFDASLELRDRVAITANLFFGNVQCISELIMSGICHRHPTLKFVSVESGVGFLPYLVEALDWQFLNQNLWREYPDWLLPSEYFRRQIYGCFWFEKDVARVADLFPDNFMFETDFNHPTSLTPAEAFPHISGPQETIVENLSGMPPELVRKLLHDNAARVYDLG